MPKEIKQKNQDLGIFYTDQRIVNFIFDILKVWKEKEERETGRWDSKNHYPSVIDPAVGEGVFLKSAVQNNFTKTEYIFGLDVDVDAVKRWKVINLLKEFGGKEDDLEAHFFHQNGLDKIHWEQHIKKDRYKLKQKDISAQQFDTVVGNPPYGGIGIDFKGKLTVENTKLLASLEKFEIFPYRKLKKSKGEEQTELNSLFLNEPDIKDVYIKKNELIKLAHSFPIEILFLERFIQLAKPGGWIAVIIPDGILTNSNSCYVREFISEKAKVEAIISLPRCAFKSAGTSAKTSILFLKKYKNEERKQSINYPVFLASVNSLEKKKFNFVKNNYEECYNKIMSNKNLVQITTDEKGQEVVMVRADKTLEDIMTSKPNSRWDAGFWLPKYDEVLEEMKDKIQDIDYFSSFIEEIGQGDVPRKNRDEKFVERGVRFIEVEHIKNTGIYFYDTRFVTESQYKRLKRVELVQDSMLIVRSGATIGKVAIVAKVYDKAVVNGHINRIICKKINPYYITVFLKTKYGQLQLERLQRGVAQPELNFEEISSIEIAVLDVSIQKNIESEYKKMSTYHDKAMEAKKNNNEAEYKKNIETAEKMLNDLISKTEAVIRGERDDVI